MTDGGVHSQVWWRDQQRGRMFGEGLSSVHPKRLMFGKGVGVFSIAKAI